MSFKTLNSLFVLGGLTACLTIPAPALASDGKGHSLTFQEHEGTSLDSQEGEGKPDLIFEDPNPVQEAANPNIGLAASVVAATPKQNTPSFFSDAELLLSRLPSLTGDVEASLPEGFDFPEENGEPTEPEVRDSGPTTIAVSKDGETFQSHSYADRVPGSFTLERSNTRSNRNGTVSVSSRIWGESWHGPVPGIKINARLESQQIHAERRGAKRILSRPKAEVSATAFLPIDDGGAAIEAHAYISATVPDRGMILSVLPYSEDALANLGLVPQIRSYVGQAPKGLAASTMKEVTRISGIPSPHAGDQPAREVMFSFPPTARGKPRGLLITVEGSAKPEIVSKRDTFLGNDAVTEITEQAMHEGQIIVRLSIAYPIDN